jgi:hypothetical protein
MVSKVVPLELEEEAAPLVTEGYVLYPFQSEMLLADESVAEAGKLAVAVMLFGAAALAAAIAHGDFASFAAGSASPLERMRGLDGTHPSTAQSLAGWLSSTPTAGASVVTVLACSIAAIPLLLRAAPLRPDGLLPRLGTATAKAAAFYAAVWLSLGRTAVTVIFLRQLMLAASHSADDLGLTLRRAVWLGTCVLWLCRALGVLDMDLLPFVDLPDAWALFINTLWVGTPFAGFFQLYFATNAAASAWRAPLATLGVFAACAVAFAVAAAACDALSGGKTLLDAWRFVGGDEVLRGAWKEANAALVAGASPLYVELSGWYDTAQTFVIKHWMPASSASSGVSASAFAWLGRAAGVLFGGSSSAREGLAARGARAAADIARDNALFLVAFHLGDYCSAAELRKAVFDAFKMVALGGVLLAVAIAVGGAADTDWVHGPCFRRTRPRRRRLRGFGRYDAPLLDQPIRAAVSGKRRVSKSGGWWLLSDASND